LPTTIFFERQAPEPRIIGVFSTHFFRLGLGIHLSSGRHSEYLAGVQIRLAISAMSDGKWSAIRSPKFSVSLSFSQLGRAGNQHLGNPPTTKFLTRGGSLVVANTWSVNNKSVLESLRPSSQRLVPSDYLYNLFLFIFFLIFCRVALPLGTQPPTLPRPFTTLPHVAGSLIFLRKVLLCLTPWLTLGCFSINSLVRYVRAASLSGFFLSSRILMYSSIERAYFMSGSGCFCVTFLPCKRLTRPPLGPLHVVLL